MSGVSRWLYVSSVVRSAFTFRSVLQNFLHYARARVLLEIMGLK